MAQKSFISSLVNFICWRLSQWVTDILHKWSKGSTKTEKLCWKIDAMKKIFQILTFVLLWLISFLDFIVFVEFFSIGGKLHVLNLGLAIHSSSRWHFFQYSISRLKKPPFCDVVFCDVVFHVCTKMSWSIYHWEVHLISRFQTKLIWPLWDHRAVTTHRVINISNRKEKDHRSLIGVFMK